jgi:hypothetical protein
MFILCGLNLLCVAKEARNERQVRCNFSSQRFLERLIEGVERREERHLILCIDKMKRSCVLEIGDSDGRLHSAAPCLGALRFRLRLEHDFPVEFKLWLGLEDNSIDSLGLEHLIVIVVLKTFLSLKRLWIHLLGVLWILKSLSHSLKQKIILVFSFLLGKEIQVGIRLTGKCKEGLITSDVLRSEIVQLDRERHEELCDLIRIVFSQGRLEILIPLVSFENIIHD